MIHPLVLGISLLDLLGLALLLAAALRGERVLRGWAPGSASAQQLELERGMEAGGLLARAGAGLLLLSSLGLLLAITAVLPQVVPGAMCGTGVITAMQGLGVQALTLRGLALMLLTVWFVLDRLDRACPQAPLAPLVGLALVVATPMCIWAGVETARALYSLDTHEAVDCCAALYEEAGGAGAAAGAAAASWTLYAFGAGAVLLLLASAWSAWQPSLHAWRLSPWVLLGLAWPPVAQEVLVGRLAAYHYEVLAHHCPWCLFLPEHGGVGYPLFGALAWVMVEATAAATAGLAARSQPQVAGLARARVRSAGQRMLGATVLFLGVALGPAVLWWWRYGVWLN